MEGEYDSSLFNNIYIQEAVCADSPEVNTQLISQEFIGFKVINYVNMTLNWIGVKCLVSFNPKHKIHEIAHRIEEHANESYEVRDMIHMYITVLNFKYNIWKFKPIIENNIIVGIIVPILKN